MRDMQDSKNDDVYGIILAAGKGSRMGLAVNKMLLPLGDSTVLNHSCLAFESLAEIKAYLLVAAAEEIPAVEKMLPAHTYTKLLSVIPGGSSRAASAKAGLDWLAGQNISATSLVLIHDGARALVPPEVILRCLEILRAEHCAVAAAIPVTDNIRQVDGQGKICHSPDRDTLYAMQTPQGARLDLFLASFAAPQNKDLTAVDDLALLGQIGYPLRLAEGDVRNIKITNAADLAVAEILLQKNLNK